MNPTGNAEKVRVLVADDDAVSRKFVVSRLRNWGYEVTAACDGGEARDILCGDSPPCLAVLDWTMPVMDGIDVIRYVRRQHADLYTYMILLTARDNRDDTIAGLDAGADDYLTKPVDVAALRSRTQVGRRIVDLQGRLVAANNELDALAKTDRLTGFSNRRALYENLRPSAVEGDAARASTTSFIMMDIDHFKRINDEHGHDAGDAVLVEFSQRVRSLLRKHDAVCRMGGEEFLLVAPNASEPDGARIAERVRAAIHDRPFQLPDGTHASVSCSLGVCTAEPGSETENEACIKKADAALYMSKSKGRNQVTVHTDVSPLQEVETP